MSKFKSFAQSGSFRDYQIEAPDETAKIEKETQRNLRGRQRAQDFLEENNRIYLRAQQLAQGQEETQRERNFKLETENRQAYKDALKRDFDIETQNDRNKAAAQEKLFKDLSSFSKTAFDLYRSVEENITKNQIRDNANRAYAAGADLETVTSIQNLSDNLTRAEFAQQDFIRQKIEEGGDIDALYALYQNRSTRGFINNIAVAQNTAVAQMSRVDLEMNAWSLENDNATVEQKRTHFNTLIREAVANVGTVDGRSMNGDLLNQHVYNALRKYETGYLTQFDKETTAERKQQVADDTNKNLNQKWVSDGASGVLSFLYENPSPEKFAIFSNWVVNKSKDLTDMGLSTEQINEILDTPFPGPDKDSEGKPIMTTLRARRSGKDDVAAMTEAARVRLTNKTNLFYAEERARQVNQEQLIRQKADEFGIDGDRRYSPEEIREMEEMESQAGPGWESPTLKDIKESQTGDAQSDAVGIAYLEEQRAKGNLTPKLVQSLPLTAKVKAEYMKEAQEQQSYYSSGDGKSGIDQIKAVIKSSQFVKIMPITGAASWTVKSYTDKQIALYKKLREEAKAIPGMTDDQVLSKVIEESRAYVNNRANFDIKPGGAQTGELISELNAVKQGVGDFNLNAIQYKQFNQALSNPAFQTDAAYAGASIGIDNIRNSIKMMTESGQVPEMIRVAAMTANRTPYEFINWVTEAAGEPGIELSPIAQKMAEAALNPVTKRYFTHPTKERIALGVTMNNGGTLPVRGTIGVSSASYGTPSQRAALNAIAANESGGFGYDAVNQGGSDDGKQALGFSGRYSEMPTSKYKGKRITDLSVGQILEEGNPRYDTLSTQQFQDAGGIHAVGRYQFIHDTLKALIERHSIPLNAKFTPELQDYLAISLNNTDGSGQWVGPDEQQRAIIELGRSEPLGPPPLTY